MNRRRHPPMRLTVPVYKGPVTRDPQGRADAQRLRNMEIQTARGARRNQQLSIYLSAMYHRNVFAAGRLQPNVWVEGSQKAVDRSDFVGPVHYGLPDRDFLLRGEYEGVAVSWPMAEDLLARDGLWYNGVSPEEMEDAEALLDDAEVLAFLRRKVA